MFKNNKKTITKPSLPICIIKIFLALIAILVLMVLIIPDTFFDYIQEGKVFLREQSDTIQSNYFDYRVANKADPEADLKARTLSKNEIIHRAINGNVYYNVTVDGEELINVFGKYVIAAVLPTEDGDSKQIIYTANNVYSSHEKEFEEISHYMNDAKNFDYPYYLIIKDAYYDPNTDTLYPGKVNLYAATTSNVPYILLPELFDSFDVDLDGEPFKTYDLAPDNAADLVYISAEDKDVYLLFNVCPSEPKEYTVNNISELGMYETDYKIYSGLVEYSIKARAIFLFSTILLFIVIISALAGTIRYYDLRSTYEVFEYRRATTNAMAHDLKTPLAIASVYVANLKEHLSKDNSKCEEDANEIEDSITYMNNLINNIFEFSKSEEASATINQDAFDVSDEINNYIKSVDAFAKSKGLTITINGKSVRKTDKKLWTQSINNLIDNAIRHSSNNSEIKINISDADVVITNSTDADIKDVDKLTEPFIKGDEQRGENSGSGLGLAIAKNNLNRLGYKLTLSYRGKKFQAKISK